MQIVSERALATSLVRLHERNIRIRTSLIPYHSNSNIATHVQDNIRIAIIESPIFLLVCNPVATIDDRKLLYPPDLKTRFDTSFRPS